ncbi:2-hydroxy-6-oxononadienedioate/2-hydroxy-6-oxononatrienedioate hydrolase-like [Glandiceps talaboti]
MTSVYRGEDPTTNSLKRIDVHVLETTFNVSYADIGPRDGPVIMCLHGSPATYRSYHTLFQPLTAAGLRLILPNLPGMGYTEVDDKGVFNFSPEHKVELIKGLTRELKLERIHMLLGHSLGSHLAGHVAADLDIIQSVGFLCGPGVTMHYTQGILPDYVHRWHMKCFSFLLNTAVKIPIIRDVVLTFVKVAYKQIGLMGKTPISNVHSICEASQMDFKQFHKDINQIAKRKLPVLFIYCEDDVFIRPDISHEVIQILGMGEENTIRYNQNGIRCNLQGVTDNKLHRVVVFEEGGHRPHWKWSKAVSEEIINMIRSLNKIHTIGDNGQVVFPFSNL